MTIVTYNPEKHGPASGQAEECGELERANSARATAFARLHGADRP